MPGGHAPAAARPPARARPPLAELDALGWSWRRSPRAAAALELPPGNDVTKTQSYRAGWVEVQDLGSQLVLAAAPIRPGGRWLDACAGAGGKTLQLAGLLGPGGQVEARDVRPAALAELGRRAARAGLAGRIAFGGAVPAGGFDGVLVDAPCSGSGTWRRAPHLRWFTTPGGVAAAARLQGRILAANAPLVRAGGLLVYATCSLCRSENELVVERFLAGAPEFSSLQPGQNLRPPDPDGDAFFVAVLRRAGPA
jgi:16S rRNA (cytosine967-C5)-methyltransferase